MRILLIQPPASLDKTVGEEYRTHGRFKALRGRDSVFLRPVSLPPLGLMYLATPLLNAGHDVEIVDAPTLHLTLGETFAEAEAFKPDAVGISLYFHTLKPSWLLTRMIRERLGIPIVLGGPHVTATPDSVFAEYREADHLMTGWGDFTITPLADMIAGMCGPESVPGLWWRENGDVRFNPAEPLPDDLDRVPPPNRDVLANMYERRMYYNIMSRRRNTDVIMTSRNCPFSCRFCYNLVEHGYLSHSPERVLSEIRALADRNIDTIEIMDDTFTIHRKRVERILDGIIEAGLDIDFRIRSRVNLIDDALLKRLKEAGVRAISFGMESGSNRVLEFMDKKTTVAMNENAAQLTKKHGIICHTTWMAGFPGETWSDLEKTFALIRTMLPTTFNITRLIPLPGTEVYNEAKRNGSLVGDWGVHKPQPHVRTEIVGDDSQPFGKTIAARYRKLLLNPRYILRTIRYALFPPNMRLFRYGIDVVLGRLRNFT